jgi:TRAP-type C4-dicarboxylate transport system permease large subunit
VASVSSIGGTLIPEMNRKGYARDFNIAVTASAATTGLLIPPSNNMIPNLCIGLLTPPVGTCLFVGAGVGKSDIVRVPRAMLPFYAVMVGVQLGIIYWPALSLALPRLFHK